jgi:putative acetyltransferase
MIVQPLDPAEPAAGRLLAASDAYLGALYPAASNHLEDVAALRRPNVRMFGGYLGGELVACGAVKLMTDDGVYAEIKRVFVVASHRGRGLSTAIMLHIEQHLRRAGISVARLETGIRQPEALGLYAKLGYTLRAPFGGYRPDPLSVFMEKHLGQTAASDPGMP